MRSRSRSQQNPTRNACEVDGKSTVAAEDACEEINRTHVYPLRTVGLRTKKQLPSKIR